MKKTIKHLSAALQVSSEGRTYVEDCNCTIVKNVDEEYKYYVTNHDFLKEAKKFKTFKGALNYMYPEMKKVASSKKSVNLRGTKTAKMKAKRNENGNENK